MANRTFGTSDKYWTDPTAWAEGYVPLTTDHVIFNASSASCTIDDDVVALDVNCTGYTHTLTGESGSSLTLSGSLFKAVAGMTLVFNATFVLTMLGSIGVLTPAGKTFGVVNITGAGNRSIDNVLSCAYCHLTGTALKTDKATLYGDITATYAITFNGNSSTNRLTIMSDTPGTARTLSATILSGQHFNLQDMIGAGAGYDVSEVDGGSGDCGGNTSIKFTTAQPNYWVGGSNSWAAASTPDNQWASTSGGSGGTGRVPLPQDTARFDDQSFVANSRTVTMNMPYAGSINWQGVTHSPTWGLGSNSFSIIGSLYIDANMSVSSSSGQITTFEGRGNYLLTTNGKVMRTVIVAAIGGKITLQDDYVMSSFPLTVSNGELDAYGHAITCAAFSSAGSATRKLTMGSGTWTVSSWTTATSGDASGLTLDKGTSTLIIIGASTQARLGGLSYHIVTITGDNTIIYSSNSFDVLNNNTAGLATGLKFYRATTQTVNAFGTNGYADNRAKLRSDTTAVAYIAKAGGGVVSVDYMDIDYSSASPGTTWYAGTHSVDGGHNVNWIFTDPPAGSTEWTLDLADSITPTDALSYGMGLGFTDSFSVLDALSQALGVGMSDGFVVSDSLSQALGLGLADNITPSDILSQAVGMKISDNVTISDLLSQAIGLKLADGVTITEYLSQALGMRLADSITPADLLSTSLGMNISDNIAISDLLSARLGMNLADAITISDLLDLVSSGGTAGLTALMLLLILSQQDGGQDVYD